MVYSKSDGESLLKQSLGNPEASFRDGQWEAISGIVNERKKLLVVQRTGWGKSSVYFIATKMLRSQGQGPTIIISPLLALMRNQISAAANLGIQAVTFNSTNKDQWAAQAQQMATGIVDVILVSPETLNNQEFNETILASVINNIGLLVVDEAHCISDWGHDFRPDYRRILNIIQLLPANMPLLGTTATANQRVIDDIKAQMPGIEVQRGPLLRKSLKVQNLTMSDQIARLAWLSKTIPLMPGTGIVYALTKRDALIVTKWLKSQNIAAEAYFSDVLPPDRPLQDGETKGAVSNAYRQQLEQALSDDQLKVLVATSALGMGYDKPNLSFVFHYQAPGNIVSYYQQVGRAGRSIDSAYGILLSGKEDEKIHTFFRKAAFPSENQVNRLLATLDQHDGLSTVELQKHLNLSGGAIQKVLKMLDVENPAPVIKQGTKWHRTPVPFAMDQQRIDHLTHQREIEWQDMSDYIQSTQCLMQHLGNSLDDPHAEPCGKCANCIDGDILDPSISRTSAIEAARLIKQSELPFPPKKQVASGAFPIYGFTGNLKPEIQNSEGRILSRWADAGWGGIVEEDKNNGRISDQLVEAMADMILHRWQRNPDFTWITCIPSLNTSQLVPDFAQRLADRIGIPFIPAISKIRQNEQQKFQQNRYHQCKNLDGVFAVTADAPAEPVLLLDDIIDSGWTMTVAGALLRQHGCHAVYPAALATTSTSV